MTVSPLLMTVRQVELEEARPVGYRIHAPALFAVALAAAVCLAGCQRPLVQAPQAERSQAAVLTEGYSLLYDVVSKQKNADLLLKLRDAKPAVRDVVTAMAEEAGNLSDWLEQRKDQLESESIELDAANLPELEAAARQAIESDTTKQLLFGDRLEPRLLVSQMKSAAYLSALAWELADRETSQDRAEWLNRFAERMTELHSRAAALIAVNDPS